MTKTYEVTKSETEEFVVETATTNSQRTYHKDWLVSEIAKLQAILDQFPK